MQPLRKEKLRSCEKSGLGRRRDNRNLLNFMKIGLFSRNVRTGSSFEVVHKRRDELRDLAGVEALAGEDAG